jgi:Fur family ferric uptake transcriptional regulator
MEAHHDHVSCSTGDARAEPIRRCESFSSGVHVVLDMIQFIRRVEVVVVRNPPQVECLLRDAALRVTAPRKAVLSAVHEYPHADTESLLAVTRARLGSVSHQAVYDVLRALTDAGLVRRIQPAGSAARYEARVGDNHHHVVCRSCGAVSDVDCAIGEPPCSTGSDDAGFAIDEAEVVYWGLCPACQSPPPGRC